MTVSPTARPSTFASAKADQEQLAQLRIQSQGLIDEAKAEAEKRNRPFNRENVWTWNRKQPAMTYRVQVTLSLPPTPLAEPQNLLQMPAHAFALRLGHRTLAPSRCCRVPSQSHCRALLQARVTVGDRVRLDHAEMWAFSVRRCLRLVFPLPSCVAEALPCASAALATKTLLLPYASTALTAKTLSSPCVPTAAVAKAVPFLATDHDNRR